MSSAIRIVKSTAGYSDELTRLGRAIDDADSIVIGAGAGLSVSAGFTYSGERFTRNFSDFEEKYGFHDMYAGSFCRFETPEEQWAFWSRMISLNRYSDAPIPVYRELLELVRDKDYFVITTNVDHQFQKAGFDKDRLFYVQGDYGLFQCSGPCCAETYDNEDVVREMLDRQDGMRIPSELIPHCPHCDRPMTMNLRSDDRFVEDAGWHEAANRYGRFLRDRSDARLVFMELGVGFNTPGIIKYPFWGMTAQNSNATYVCINVDSCCPVEIQSRSICIDGDIAKVLEDLKRVP